MNRRVRIWMWVAPLSLAGILGNFVNVPLFFGVDFVFGSIAAFVAIALLGPAPGIVVAAIAGACTILLWGHPYAAIIFTLEACFVALMGRRTGQLTLADAAYWLGLGIPGFVVLLGSAGAAAPHEHHDRTQTGGKRDPEQCNCDVDRDRDQGF